ncbi:DUF2905 domain-containing protein [Trichlorobacter ammonificans]|uniref:Membrane protein n=1 Tax=Trichlorobacter ammonificans TaxID=2916410 RepID=A0ABN8HIZ1_9BACT|nr:DUF2905 domain-containing protein [Trichlorobacter ammonificans]CAH2031248.1 Membrane protein [Trichlorobacter ammonificans]
MSGVGKSLIILGVLLVAAGVVLSLAPRVPWLGKLPGDILIKRENVTVYLPIATSLLLSLVLSLLFWFFRK